jgi:hypothetical protein
VIPGSTSGARDQPAPSWVRAGASRDSRPSAARWETSADVIVCPAENQGPTVVAVQPSQ